MAMLGRGLRGRLGSFAVTPARGGRPAATTGQHTATQSTARVGRNVTTTAAKGGTGARRAGAQPHAIGGGGGGDGGGDGGPKAAETFPTAAGHYPHLERIQTRWNDHDAFGHINNVQFYQCERPVQGTVAPT